MTTSKRFGWKPDLPDWRDKMYAVSKPLRLPPAFDLRAPGKQVPRVRDQGQLGSCTGFSIAGGMGYVTGLDASPLFIYYNERAMEGTINSDDGANIRDGIKSLVKLGAAAEADWPYNPTRFAAKPGAQAYANALKHRVTEYRRVPRTKTLRPMKTCLLEGFPIVFGFSVYEGFMSDRTAQTGIVPLPDTTQALVGGHAVLAIGWDDSKDSMLVRNSWGPDWGWQGHFWLPYEYFTNPNLSDDFWTVRK